MFNFHFIHKGLKYNNNYYISQDNDIYQNMNILSSLHSWRYVMGDPGICCRKLKNMRHFLFSSSSLSCDRYSKGRGNDCEWIWMSECKKGLAPVSLTTCMNTTTFNCANSHMTLPFQRQCSQQAVEWPSQPCNHRYNNYCHHHPLAMTIYAIYRKCDWP